jgi:hypothetical protein
MGKKASETSSEASSLSQEAYLHYFNPSILLFGGLILSFEAFKGPKYALDYITHASR